MRVALTSRPGRKRRPRHDAIAGYQPKPSFSQRSGHSVCQGQRMKARCTVATLHSVLGISLKPNTTEHLLLQRSNWQAKLAMHSQDLCYELDRSSVVATLLLRWAFHGGDGRSYEDAL